MSEPGNGDGRAGCGGGPEVAERAAAGAPEWGRGDEERAGWRAGGSDKRRQRPLCKRQVCKASGRGGGGGWKTCLVMNKVWETESEAAADAGGRGAGAPRGPRRCGRVPSDNRKQAQARKQTLRQAICVLGCCACIPAQVALDCGSCGDDFFFLSRICPHSSSSPTRPLQGCKHSSSTRRLLVRLPLGMRTRRPGSRVTPAPGPPRQSRRGRRQGRLPRPSHPPFSTPTGPAPHAANRTSCPRARGP